MTKFWVIPIRLGKFCTDLIFTESLVHKFHPSSSACVRLSEMGTTNKIFKILLSSIDQCRDAAKYDDVKRLLLSESHIYRIYLTIWSTMAK